jgi:hypothetical protein
MLPGTNGLFGSALTNSGQACNPAYPFGSLNLAPGLRAWGVKLHALPTSPVTYGVTETALLPSILSLGELVKLTNLCQFIVSNASGAGQCNSCKASSGGL